MASEILRRSAAERVPAIGYVRVSTDKQADRGTSLSVQRDRIVEHCVLNGLALVRVEEDSGISGAKGDEDRPGFAAALEAIRRREARVLVVTDVDRLSRDGDGIGYVRTLVRKAGGKVVVISEAGEGVEVVAVRQLLAVLEREKTRARMRVWAASRKARGLRMGPKAATSTEVVERMLVMRATGASLRAVAAALNADGVLAPRGGQWAAGSVAAVLRRVEKA